MHKLLPLMSCLMLLLIGWSSMAHAAEPVGGNLAGIAFTVHAPGDGDEVPADGDTGVPHHHGVCHSHDTAHPAMAAEPAYSACLSNRGFVFRARILTAADQNVALRPPKA